MNLKKLLITITVPVAFIGSFTAVSSSFNLNRAVLAASKAKEKLYDKYSGKFHKVVITDEPIQVYKVHRHANSISTFTKAYKLYPGDTAYIRDRGVTWGWTIGKSYNYCSTKDCYDFDWFEPYSKYTYLDKSYFDTNFPERKIVYKLTWNQIRKLYKLRWDQQLNNSNKAEDKRWSKAHMSFINKIKPPTYELIKYHKNSYRLNRINNKKTILQYNRPNYVQLTQDISVYKIHDKSKRVYSHKLKKGSYIMITPSHSNYPWYINCSGVKDKNVYVTDKLSNDSAWFALLPNNYKIVTGTYADKDGNSVNKYENLKDYVDSVNSLNSYKNK